MTIDLRDLEGLETSLYYYDMRLLQQTIDEITMCMSGYPYSTHYAVKANCNPEILKTIAGAGFGADCVSGGELRAALEAGFPASEISYAGVGKTDAEIRYGIEEGIGCFNTESVEEHGEILQGTDALLDGMESFERTEILCDH